MENPFVDAKSKTPKAKILLWGSYGTGKTWQALHFPAPVMIDMERGSEQYASDFQFKVFHATDPDKVMQGVAWLRKNKHEQKTLILDSMTEFWSALQKKWTDIFLVKQSGKGNKGEFYELQPRDWGTIKAEFKDFLRKMLDLDMNIICTCRQKDLYEEGAFLKKIGETQDSDRSLPYLFDTVVRLEKTAEGGHIATVEKDRTNLLPKRFTANYVIFAYAFELEDFEKIVIPDQYLPQGLKGKQITGEMTATNHGKVVWDGKKPNKDEVIEYKGRQLLHVWEGKESQECKLFAKRLLAKYPSKKDLANHQPPAMVTAGITQSPDAEPAPDTAKAQS